MEDYNKIIYDFIDNKINKYKVNNNNIIINNNIELPLISNPNHNYITPSNSHIDNICKTLGLKSYNYTLIKNMANIISGGNIIIINNYINIVININHNNNGININSIIKYHNNLSDFLLNININKLIGNTPLEKSIFFLKLLKPSTKNKLKSNNFGLSLSNDNTEDNNIEDDNIEINIDANRVNRFLDKINKLSDNDKLLLNLDNDNNIKEKIDTISDLVNDSKLDIIIDKNKILNEYTHLKNKKNDRSDDKSDMYIENISNLSKINSIDFALYSHNKTLFNYNAITRKFIISDNKNNTDKKQFIFILLDGSGSMQGIKSYKSLSIIMNRLKAVIEGNSICYIGVFNDDMKTPELINNLDTAKSIMNKFLKYSYTDGSTNITNSILSAYLFIQKEYNNNYNKPEIFVITDEDSSIKKLNTNLIPNTIINGFCINSTNSDLKSICIKTGGVCIENF